MKTFIYDVYGKVKTEEEALAEFWAYMEKYNGNRRRKPQEFVKDVKAVHVEGGGWKVKCTVPNEVLREKEEKGEESRIESELKYSLSQDKNLEVETSKILVTGMNPRRYFDEEGMKGLVESIRTSGILQPLVVRPKGDDYELVIGERRLKAAQELGLETVPAVIREMSDEQVLEAMLTENLQREDLNPIEEAEAVKRYIDTTKLLQKDAGERLGKSETWISRRLELLVLPQDLQDLLVKGDLTPKHIEKMTPFAGYPIYTEIVRELKNRLKMRGEISVQSFEQLIDGLIKTDFHADRVLNLSTFPHEYRDRRQFFDLKACTDCATGGKKIVYETEIEADREFCIDRRCYSDKLNIAKQALEKHLEEEARQREARQEGLAPAQLDERVLSGESGTVSELVKVEALLRNEGVLSSTPVKPEKHVALTVEIREPNEDDCDGCPAWDCDHAGCVEGYTNVINCPQHAEASEPVRKIRAEVEEEIFFAPPVKHFKCHVLDCTNENVEGSHYCADHRTPESRKKEEPMGNLRCAICKGLSFSVTEGDNDVLYMLQHFANYDDDAHYRVAVKVARIAADELRKHFEEVDL